MSKTKSSTSRGRIVRVGLAAGATSALVAAMTASPAFAAAGTLALSSTGGPSAGGNTIIVTFATNPTAPTPTSFGAATTAQFVVQSSATAVPTCPLTYATPGTNQAVTGTNLKVLAANRLGITVPIGVTHTITANASTKYALCVYNGSTAGTSPLVGSGQYSVGLKPTLLANGAVSPTNGPALGGSTITVYGANFVQNTAAAPNNTTATIGGLALKDINVAVGGASFTATTPAHAAGGPFTLTVTTPGGTVSTLGGTTTKADVFSFTNGINITPNTASNTKQTPTDVDVSGVGFQAMDFTTTTGTTPIDTHSHIYLTNGPYNATGLTTTTTGNKANGPVTECLNVLVVSDTEVLCSLNLSNSLTAAGVAALNRTLTVTATTGTKTITSATGGFTSTDVGSAIAVPSATPFVNQIIASVQSAYQATLTTAAIATATAVATITPHTAPTGTIATSTSSAVLTGAAGDFVAGDVGRAVSGTGIAAGATIIAVAADGSTATMSANATAVGAAVADITIAAGVPVPSDAYNLTVVSNGAVGANVTDANFVQSNISSGSTFTVADY